MHLADLVGQGVLSQGMADFLDLAVRGRKNIVVSGPAGSGRSTLLGALARAAEGERIVLVEEAEELDLGEGPWVALVARGTGAREAITNALRLRPERLVVGDVRGAEAFEVVSAVAGGAAATLCAVIAGSARDALTRLESLARLAAEAPSPGVLADELARGVHLVVHLARTAEGDVRVAEIAEVAAGQGSGVPPNVQAVFTGAGARFQPTGHVPVWAEAAQQSMFRA
jgi:pilus assembly protein CpaF